MFLTSKGGKNKISQNSPKYGLVSEKTRKTFRQLFWKRGGGGGVRPKLTNEPGDETRGGRRSESSSVHSADAFVTRPRPIG